jgi:uncharacterized protein YoxC
MTVEYVLLAIGAFSIAAFLIWNKIQIRKRMLAIDSQLKKIHNEINALQKEANVLQMQESRRLLMELNANSKPLAAKNDPHNPVEIGGGDVVRLMKPPPAAPAQ